MISKYEAATFTLGTIVLMIAEIVEPGTSEIVRSVLLGAATGCWFQLRLFFTKKIQLSMLFVETLGTILSSYAAFVLAYSVYAVRDQLILDLCCMAGGFTGAFGLASWAAKKYGLDVNLFKKDGRDD